MTDCLWIEADAYRAVAGQLKPGLPLKERAALLDVITLYNRINALSTIHHAGRGWIGASFSIAEIMTALYFDAAHLDRPDDPARDTVLLSKGHASVMQYAVLAAKGLLSIRDLQHFNCPNGPQAHTDRSTPGIETNTGSLGQTLSKAAGLALGGAHRVFVILGDGELQEGQNYEAFMTLHQNRLAQVVPIIDRNGIQSDSEIGDIKAIPDLEGVLRGFGFQTMTFNGHDMPAVLEALRAACEAQAPTVLIANTRKASGVSFMEADHTRRRAFSWHGRAPERQDYLAALREWADKPQARLIQSALRDFLDHATPEAPIANATDEEALPTGPFFGRHLAQRAIHDARIILLDADLEKSCRLTDFARNCPDRFIEMGIAEQDMVSCAGGLALRGKIPVVNTFTAFLRRAFEQTYTNATEHSRVIYAGHYAGLSYFTDGKSHQCTGDVAMMRSIPGMRVVYPAFNEEIPQILSWYLDQTDADPLYLRLHAKPCPLQAVSPVIPLFNYGRGFFLRRNGARDCILTSGPHMTQYCAAAVDTLAENGIPFDLCIVSSLTDLQPEWTADIAGAYAGLVIAEELFDTGGLFDEFNRSLACAREQGICFSTPHLFHRAVRGLPFSTLDPQGLYEHFRLTPEHLTPFFANCSTAG